MPGVPSSRGCEGCRKQKKRCDQSKPTCSRCARLKIKCVGGGQQRYKFRDESSHLNLVSMIQLPVIVMPSNQDTLLLSSIVSTLGVIDVRYDLTYYGGFLSGIPSRLGSNDALDASVAAVAASFPFMHTGKRSPDMLEKYGYALKQLRIDLSDPKKAYTSDTLCAIYLMDICQSWIGKRDDHLLHSHGEVMAHLLNAAPVDKWRDSFEIEMMMTVRSAVAMESFANPTIKIDQFFENLTGVYGKKFGPQRSPADNGVPLSMSLPTLAKMGKFFRDPELHLVEISAMYQESLQDYQIARQRLEASEKTLGATRTPLEAYPVTKHHTTMQAALGMVGSIVLNLGSILRVFSPEERSLSEVATKVSLEVMALAEDARKYRPLGSCYIPFCLISAWAAADGPLERAPIETLLEDWQSDFREARWLEMAGWLNDEFEDLRLRLMLSQLRVEPIDCMSSLPTAPMGGPNSCSVM